MSIININKRKISVKRAMKAATKKRKLDRLRSAEVDLSYLGVPFKVLNKGIHFQITLGYEVVNFYPTTGVWLTGSNTTKHKTGIQGVLQYCRARMKNKESALFENTPKSIVSRIMREET